LEKSISTLASTRPYLVRAIFDWALDNGLTPHILVDAGAHGVKAPPGYARDGKITLNIHPQSVQGLELGKEWVMFSARFSGRSFAIEIPIGAVLAVFARENGQGFFFQSDTADGDGDKPEPTPPEAAPPRKGPSLKVVK
jgi:stringent starvation protein B